MCRVQVAAVSTQRPSVPPSTHAPVAPPTVGGPLAAPPTVGVSSGALVPPTVQSSVSGPAKFDLLADFSSDPFTAPTKSATASSK